MTVTRIENHVVLGQLFAVYGSLLTSNQQAVLQLTLNEDWSLAEISDVLKISRQAVHDTLRRGCDTLTHLEAHLGTQRRQAALLAQIDACEQQLLQNQIPAVRAGLSQMRSLVNQTYGEGAKDGSV